MVYYMQSLTGLCNAEVVDWHWHGASCTSRSVSASQAWWQQHSWYWSWCTRSLPPFMTTSAEDESDTSFSRRWCYWQISETSRFTVTWGCTASCILLTASDADSMTAPVSYGLKQVSKCKHPLNKRHKSIVFIYLRNKRLDKEGIVYNICDR